MMEQCERLLGDIKTNTSNTKNSVDSLKNVVNNLKTDIDNNQNRLTNTSKTGTLDLILKELIKLNKSIGG